MAPWSLFIALYNDQGAISRYWTLVVVQRDEQLAARADQRCDVATGTVHVASVMQNTPGIDDVELPELSQVVSIEHRSLLDHPARIVRKVAALQRLGARHRLGVEVEGMDGGSQSPGRQAEQAAAGSDIQEG